jgi:dTDP-4-dehydrorhamnose 3,5-epimerase
LRNQEIFHGHLPMIKDVIITPLKIIDVPGGNVLHGMKCSDEGFVEFGEAYFSMAETGVIKAWKRHTKMTLNLIVPVGGICFVIYDDRLDSSTHGQFQEVTLSKQKNYCRLTVPPMVWLGFQGVDESPSMLLNIASILHQPKEADRKDLKEFKFDWSLVK